MKERWDEEYKNLMRRLVDINVGDIKELRRIHKELRKYGDGIPFLDRYPGFPIVLAIVSFLVSLMALIIGILV